MAKKTVATDRRRSGSRLRGVGFVVVVGFFALLTGGARRDARSPRVSQNPQAQAQAPESETLARYRAAADGSDRPIDQYNLGTALLNEGQVGEAQLPLQESLGSEREAVRENGYYNLGLSTALDGRLEQNDAQARRAALQAAREAFREVLRNRVGDEDARWNLELVERWLEEEEESGGDGSAGGQGDSPQGSGSGAAPAGGSGDQQMLSPEQAAALLDQAGEAEASIRDRVMGRNRFQDPTVEKNW